MDPNMQVLQEAGWEDLLNEARKIEGDLDVKLSSYAKLGARFDQAGYAEGGSPTLGSSKSWKSMEMEIQSLLEKLLDINDSMSRCVTSAAPAAPAASITQKLALHRDILHEFTQEFKRIKVNMNSMRERAELLKVSGSMAPIRILPPPPPNPFSLNETVLVFFHQKLYKAMVLKTYLYAERWFQYYICYMVKNPPKPTSPKERRVRSSGKEATPRMNMRGKRKASYEDPKEEEWSEWQGWSEWVGATRLVKHTPENVIKMRRLLASKGKMSWPVERPKKEQGPEDRIDKLKEKLEKRLRFIIPCSLFIKWIEDAELSLHVGQIIEVPSITVSNILNDFLPETEEGEEAGKEIISMFDGQFGEPVSRKGKMRLSSRLLYQTEVFGLKCDLLEISEFSPSEKFGAEYLLRMLVTLFETIEGTRIIQVRGEDLQQLLFYLDDHQNDFFVPYPNGSRVAAAPPPEAVNEENALAIVVYQDPNEANANQEEARVYEEGIPNPNQEEARVYEEGVIPNPNQEDAI